MASLASLNDEESANRLRRSKGGGGAFDPIRETAPIRQSSGCHNHAMTQQSAFPPPPAQAQPSPASTNPRSALALTALILGIVAIIIAIIPIIWGLAIPVGIAAVVVGAIALIKRGKPKWFSITGIALGALSFVIAIALMINAFVQLAQLGDALDGVQPSEVTAETPAGDPSFAPDAPESAPATDLNSAFGDAITYTDDVAISVSAPAEYVPGEYAAGDEQAANVIFTLTITNNSDANLQPSTYSRVSSGGVEASRIFDSGGAVDVSSSPSTVILPGGTVTWNEAYSVADPASMIFQIAPSYDYEDSIFTNVP